MARFFDALVTRAPISKRARGHRRRSTARWVGATTVALTAMVGLTPILGQGAASSASAATGTCSATTSGEAQLNESAFTATSESGSSGPQNAITNAVNHNTPSRYTSGADQTSGMYYEVNMGSAQTFNEIEMNAPDYSNDYARGFNVEVSTNGSTWTTVASCTGSANPEIVSFTGATDQYLQVVLTAAVTTNWWSIEQFFIYNGSGTTTTGPTTTIGSTTTTTAGTTTTTKATTTTTKATTTTTASTTTTSSSTTTTAPGGVNCSAAVTEGTLSRSGWVASSNTSPSASDAPANALDGNLSTRFSSDAGQAAGMYWQADMGAPQTFNEIGMQVPNSSLDFARGYSIEVSNNGTTFTTVATCTSITDPELVSFAPQTAQYFRVVLTQAGSSWWSVDELYAYSATGVPPAGPPTDELTANPNGTATFSWPASQGATSYNVYRGTTSGGEGSTPYASLTGTTFIDTHMTPGVVYYYEVTAVNAYGQSPSLFEDETPSPPPVFTGGTTAGVASGNSEVYYCEDGLLGGPDWFLALTGWFPQVLGSTAALSPGGMVVDMAYSSDATLTFNNVSVPTAGLYTIEWRYAYESGLFPGVNNRIMGIEVNGKVITSSERFPITGGFETYEDSSLQVELNAGVNSVTLFAVSDHGISRVDEMIVTPATASVPTGPTNLVTTAGNGSVALSWSPSTSGSPTSYSIFRGTISDGEQTTPIATVSGTTTSYTDATVSNYTHYYYVVAANNSVGISPDSNESFAIPNPAA